MTTAVTTALPNGRDKITVLAPVHNFQLIAWLATDRTADVLALVEAERAAITARENAKLAGTILAELTEIARHTTQA